MKRNSRVTYRHVKNEVPNEDINDEEEIPSHSENFTSADEPRSFYRRLSDNLAYTKYIIILLFIPPILNFGALQREAAALLPKGQRVEMGWGQKAYILCEGTGLPTVILDAPTGTNSDIWLFIHEQLAQVTRVCIYDRSGIGTSDSAFSEVLSDRNIEHDKRFVAQSSTLKQMASDLHHLLNIAYPVPHPYVLVGSGVGALVARLYALEYSEEVSDIVLVDPLVETLFDDNNDWKEYWYTKLLPSYESLHLSAVVGVSRIALLFGLLNPLYFKDDVPLDVMHRQKSLLCNPRHINAAFYEHLFMNVSFLQMSENWSLKQFPKDISVSVIRRQRPAEFPDNLFELWDNSQRFLVNELHPKCQVDRISERNFLDVYSKSSPVVSTVKRVVARWKQKYGYFPAFSQ